MTDQTIPADKVRPILDEWERIKQHADWVDMDNLVQEVRALLPAPPRPTLADMTEEERDECQWMQADVYDTKGEWVIRESPHSNAVQLVNRNGKCLTVAAKDITPRPDLPRLEWPGDQKPAPAPALPDGWRLADHPQCGRVIVTNPTPGRSGGIYCVASSDGDSRGFDWHYCAPGELTYLDQEAGQ